MSQPIQDVDIVRTLPPVADVRAAIALNAKRRKVLHKLLDLALKADELTSGTCISVGVGVGVGTRKPPEEQGEGE